MEKLVVKFSTYELADALKINDAVGYVDVMVKVDGSYGAWAFAYTDADLNRCICHVGSHVYVAKENEMTFKVKASDLMALKSLKRKKVNEIVVEVYRNYMKVVGLGLEILLF